MSTSYLDTTILVAVSEEKEPTKTNSIKSINANPPKRVAYYAYRELMAGRIGLLCDLQNHVIASENLMEVAVGFYNRSWASRTNRTKAGEILQRLVPSFSQATFDPALEKRRIAEDLAFLANKAWRRATQFSSATERVHPLGCFKVGSIVRDNDGLMTGPGGTFDCAKTEGCSAIAYLFQDKAKLQAMIDALDPRSLGEPLASKPETIARRKALKRLLDRGPKDFPLSYCRKIGDAFFVQTCPPGGHVLTSNTVDFVPLCHALNVGLKSPD